MAVGPTFDCPRSAAGLPAHPVYQFNWPARPKSNAGLQDMGICDAAAKFRRQQAVWPYGPLYTARDLQPANDLTGQDLGHNMLGPCKAAAQAR